MAAEQPHEQPLSALGRKAKVAVLVYNDASTDSRVLKTTATLVAAGADARIIASARPLAGKPEGLARIGELPVYRAPDLSLPLMFPRLAKTWRKLRGKSSTEPTATTAPVAKQDANSTAKTAATQAEPSSGTGAAPSSGLSQAAKAATGLAGDLWMRLYQSLRLAYWWRGAVRAGVAMKPDVIHANDANALVPAMRIAAKTGARVIYDSHELWRRRNIRQDRILAPAVEAIIERVGVRRAAGIITVSPSIVNWLKRTYRLREAPGLVRNIPPAHEVPDPGLGKLRLMAGLDAADKIVSYTGGITTGRGLEETVDALALLPANVHLVLLGYGDKKYIASLEQRARTVGVAERMHLVGAVASHEVPTTLADADVAVVYVRPICLSYKFSLPNKLFESIHGGLPIVAANLPDTAQIVREYGVGEVFDASTPAELAAAITDVLADPGHYRSAAHRAAAELTWEHEAEKLIGLYTKVLGASDAEEARG